MLSAVNLNFIKKIIRKCFWIIFLLFTPVILFIIFKFLDQVYPLIEPTEIKKFSQLVVDKDGHPLRAFADQQGVWRYPTKLSNVSNKYIKALISYEDKNFWKHYGVDPLALVRAVWQFVKNGRAISGGSTLTMQVARILDPHSKTIHGKLWQIFRALQLEYHLDKQTILEMYLNYAPFGGPIEGIEAATYTYLGKSAKDLTLSEAALMAVLPQSPSRFRPDRYPERAQRARNKVLNRLQQFNIWSADEIEYAKQEMVYAEFNSRPLIAPLLSRRLAKNNPQLAIIESTIDINLQVNIADQIKHYLNRFSPSTSASAIVINNQSLEVLAYVGAGDFANKQRFGHIDMNQAIRSPGSTLKPFIYAMAIDQSIVHSQSLLQDVPSSFGHYSPHNFTKMFSGPVSLTNALQQSLNIPAVQVLNHLGSIKFSGQMKNAGVKFHFPNNSKPSLSLALGGVGIKLVDLLGAYRAFVSAGQAGKLKYLKKSPKEETFLISKESAWIVADILAQVNLEKHSGSGIFSRKKTWLAHKTGTSYGHRDALMVALTPTYSIAVWIGKPDGTPSPGEFGRKTVSPLIKKIISLLPKSIEPPPVKPEGVKDNIICWPLGSLKQQQNMQHCLQEKKAWLIDNIAPITFDLNQKLNSNPLKIQLSLNTKQRVFSSCYQGKIVQKEIPLWPARLELWLPKSIKNKQIEIHPNCRSKIDIIRNINIIGVKNNSQISASPTSNKKLSLNLIATTGQGKISWFLNGKLIGLSFAKESFQINQLKKGQQKIIVFDENGQSGSIEFVVI